MQTALGVDFGTTNSAVAVIGPDGAPRLARFPSRDGEARTFRSILYFSQDRKDAMRRPLPWTGPEAIEHYLEADGNGRLMQSMKSYLVSTGFKATQVFHVQYTLEELIAFLLRDLRAAAVTQLGYIGGPVVIGRPVHFARNEGGDDDYAIGRLRSALEQSGFGPVVFEFEPVAAAYHYERRLERDERVLIADFGGGTSDFCLIQVGPEARRTRGTAQRILGTEGVAIAGDAFDSRLIRHVVAPHLGLGSSYRALFTGELQAVPAWPYTQLRRWHRLSFLKSRDTLKLLNDIRNQAIEPEKIDALLHLVQNDLGYALYEAVERTKIELSSREQSRFVFRDPPVNIDQIVRRADFEQWIEPEVTAIAGCVDRLLEQTGIDPGSVDRVFMTGGSSFVPAVRRIFEQRFGADRLASGDELTSVASGLALRAADLE